MRASERDDIELVNNAPLRRRRAACKATRTEWMQQLRQAMLFPQRVNGHQFWFQVIIDYFWATTDITNFGDDGEFIYIMITTFEDSFKMNITRSRVYIEAGTIDEPSFHLKTEGHIWFTSIH